MDSEVKRLGTSKFLPGELLFKPFSSDTWHCSGLFKRQSELGLRIVQLKSHYTEPFSVQAQLSQALSLNGRTLRKMPDKLREDLMKVVAASIPQEHFPAYEKAFGSSLEYLDKARSECVVEFKGRRKRRIKGASVMRQQVSSVGVYASAFTAPTGFYIPPPPPTDYYLSIVERGKNRGEVDAEFDIEAALIGR
ncbi:MAG: hypothetical protein ABI599_15275 [Flavobacteriales bacterium]